jgi:predicted nuclease of predicted toxin-antitoxin system
VNFSILVDMNLSPDWIPVLTAAGHNAVHWSTAGAPTALDSDLMDWARTNDHVILTHDLDFGTLLAQTRASRPSVVTIRAQDPTPTAIGTQVLAAIQQYATELAAGALVMVDVNRSRVRVLPI